LARCLGVEHGISGAPHASLAISFVSRAHFVSEDGSNRYCRNPIMTLLLPLIIPIIGFSRVPQLIHDDSVSV
jgi:hypothetical protein